MSSSRWPLVPLGRVVRQRKEFVRVDDLQTYRRCRVQLRGQGVTLRDTVLGAELKTKEQQVCRAGELLVAEIDAKLGGFGIVPPELDGAIVSSHYFLFEIDDAAVDRDYLRYYLRTPQFQDQVTAQGTTNYAAIRPKHVLGYVIPLPPLDEQRGIATRLEVVEGRHREADLLRNRVSEILDLMFPAVVDAELARLRALGHPVSAVANHAVLVTSGPRDFAANYTPAGLRFYRAQDIGPEGRVVDDNVVCVRLPQGKNPRATVLPGDVLVVITGATIGRSAIVEDHHAEGLVSQHVGLIRVDRSGLDPRYLHLAMLAPSWAGGQLQDHKYGQGKPGLNLANLRDLRFPLPAMREQRRVVERVGAVREGVLRLQRRHREITEELAALKGSFLMRTSTG